MKKTLTFLFLSVIGLMAYSQDSEIQKDIDQQVWEVFKKSYAARDAALFNSIHTDDVLRISSREIRIGDEYKNQIAENYKRPFEGSISIDFRFEHRVHREEVAFEVGYYKVNRTNADGKEANFYGRFNVLLKKLDGIWKIAQDWDSGNINGHEVGAGDWERLAKQP